MSVHKPRNPVEIGSGGVNGLEQPKPAVEPPSGMVGDVVVRGSLRKLTRAREREVDLLVKSLEGFSLKYWNTDDRDMNPWSSHPPSLLRNRLSFLSRLPNPREGTSLWIAAGDFGRGPDNRSGDTFLFLGDALFGIRTIATNIDKEAFPPANEVEDLALEFLRRKSGIRKRQDLTEAASLRTQAQEYIRSKLSFDRLDIQNLGRYLGDSEVRHIACLNLYTDRSIGGLRDGMSSHILSMLRHLTVGGTITYSRDMEYDLRRVSDHGFLLGEEWHLGQLTNRGGIGGISANDVYMRLLRNKPK